VRSSNGTARVLCQGSEKIVLKTQVSGTNRQVARRVPRTLGSRRLFSVPALSSPDDSQTISVVQSVDLCRSCCQRLQGRARCGRHDKWGRDRRGRSTQPAPLGSGVLSRFDFGVVDLAKGPPVLESFARSTPSTPVVYFDRAPDRVANLRISLRSDAGRAIDDDGFPSLDRSPFPFALTFLCRLLFGGSRYRRWFGQSCCFGFRR
jgi:hypothetical protein